VFTHSHSLRADVSSPAQWRSQGNLRPEGKKYFYTPTKTAECEEKK